MMAGRTLDAGLHLLDRQIVDGDGCMAGKVDDLEFTPAEDDPDGPPILTALLSGPAAAAPRLGRRLGRAVLAVLELARGAQGEVPHRVEFGVVKRVEDHVELGVSRQILDSDRAERWFRDHVMAHFWGSDHASK